MVGLGKPNSITLFTKEGGLYAFILYCMYVHMYVHTVLYVCMYVHMYVHTVLYVCMYVYVISKINRGGFVKTREHIFQ